MHEPTNVADQLGRAVSARAAAAGAPPRARAIWLRHAADALDGAADRLIPIAARETHLDVARLRSELGRTTFQLRLFARLLDEGRYLDVRLDDADPDWPSGPRPDLRRMLIPVGPVVVFAASNFPFAFSVAGGDTASALAAGCSVLVKVHPGHPELSAAVAQTMRTALDTAGAPADLLQVVHGDEAGAAAVRDDRTAAVSFTGSQRVGRILMDLSAARPRPIPFYGEFGSVNPVFVTPQAARERADAIAADFVASFTLGAGQFCTKPGVVLVPADSSFIDAAARALSQTRPTTLLNEHISAGHDRRRSELAADAAVGVVAVVEGAGTDVGAALLTTTAQHFRSHADSLTEEVFGPTALLVTYGPDDDLTDLAHLFTGQLTMSVHLGSADDPVARALMPVLIAQAGRVLVDQWPTGVSVTWAQHHGGPYPATSSSLHTSVGTAAIERFLRPVAFQNVPELLMPTALARHNPWGIPRLINGAYEAAPDGMTHDEIREVAR